MRPRKPLTEQEKCVRQEMIIRRGIVYPPEARVIADVCQMNPMDVMALLNAQNEAGIEINGDVDKAVAHVPIASTRRQLAYAQVLFEDKMQRNIELGMPLTMHDPLEILDFARKAVAPMQVNVNVQQNNVLNEPQIFNLEGMSFDQLQQLISTVQGAIDSGTIIDAIATDVSPDFVGRTSDLDVAALQNVLTAPDD